MIKFLHLADLHLDSPFTSTDAVNAKEMANEQRNTFVSALGYAHKEGVKVVLLCGDLFDSEYYNKSTMDFLYEQFNSYPDCKFVISPGNHDPYNTFSHYYRFTFPPNVHIFKEKTLSSIRFDDINTTIYGYAFTSESYESRPIADFIVPNDGTFTILCAHGDTETSSSRYAPITKTDIAQSCFNYIALGHVHTKPEILKENRTYYAYSGSLCGRDFSEYGEKGGILVTYEDSSKIINIKRVTFCPWAFFSHNINLTVTRSQKEASDLILNTLHDGISLKKYIRVTLFGVIDYFLDIQKIKDLLEKFNAKIVDNTVCLNSFADLENDFSIKGEFYRSLKPKLIGDNEEERVNAFMALKIGISALNGGSSNNLI